MRPLPVVVLALCLLGLLAAPCAEATSIRMKSLPEMVAHADHVIEGRVINARAVDTGGGRIFTEYQVEVSDWLKPGAAGQAPPRTIVISQPGGQVGDHAMIVPGIPHFAPGQEILLFTRDYGGGGQQQVANASQGALEIVTDVPAARGIAPARRLQGRPKFQGGAPESLDAFRAEVRKLAAEAKR